MSVQSAPPSTDAAPAAPAPPGARRSVAPPWPVWRERLIGLAFLAAAAVLWRFGASLPAGAQAVLWAALLLALAAVARAGWLPLLGPVFLYDLVRTTRRGRYVALRAVYSAALLLFLVALYRAQPVLNRGAWLTMTGGMARFAESFCYAFLAVQFVAVAVLTPAYVAGAVAEEKDRKTLEFLLATDVRDREIVLGKMASRVANLLLLILTGLPVLSLTQLWGGVDFGLLLCAFAVTGLTLLTLAAVSMLSSVYARKAREAVVLAYLVATAYVGVSVLVELLRFFPRIMAWHVAVGTVDVSVADLVRVTGAGNPGLFGYGLYADVNSGVTLQDSLASRTGGYAAFHLLVALVCTAWAVMRVRPLALVEGSVRAKPRSEPRRWLRWRPRMGRRPLLWKEIWAEPGLSFNWFGKAILLLIVLASIVPALWIAGDYLIRGADILNSHVPDMGSAINAWVRIVGTLVACLTLLGVAVRAASSISGEHDRQTYDSLLTAPIDSNQLLFAKWLGSVLSVRRAWLWLCLVWLLGSATGGLYGPTVPWLFLAWFVYAAFVAVVGLWFSMTCRTTLRATVWTLLTVATLGVGHWYLWMVFCLPLRVREDALAWLVRFQMYGLTPPLSLAWLAFRADSVESGVVGANNADDPMGAFYCLLAGLALWSLAGYVLWRRAAWRFCVLTNRAPIPLPVSAAGDGTGTPAAPAVAAVPTPTRRSRRRALVAALAVAVFLAPVGWGIYHGVSADRHLNEAMDEVNRADPGWTMPDIETARKPIAADDNAALLVLAVGGRLPRWNDWPGDRDLSGALDSQPPEVRLSEDQHCRIVGELSQVAEARELIGPLADMSEGRYAIAWRRDFISTPLRHIDEINRTRELVRYEMMRRAEEGDADGALADCRRQLNLGRSLGDEPVMVSQNVRNHHARIAVRGAARVLAQGEPSDAALAELQGGFAAEGGRNGLENGLRGERAMTDGLLRLIQRGDIPWQFALDWLDRQDRDDNVNREALLLSLTPGAEKESRAAALRHATELIAAARLPETEMPAAFARLDARAKEMPLLARLVSVHGAKISRRHLEARAELRCAAAALAAERYRRRHGDWPASLDQLTPDLLEKVPADPFTGRPLMLRRLDDGLVIYSVGADAQDDGGDVEDSPSVKTDTAKDVGFRLWDVSRRRQQPPPAAPPGGGG